MSTIDLSRSILPGRRATAVLLTAAAGGDVLEAFLSPLDGDSTTRDLAAIAAHQGIFEVSVLVGILATLGFAAGFLGLADVLAKRSRRLGLLAGWMTAAGLAGFMGIRLAQGVQLAGVREGLDRATFAATIDHTVNNLIGATIMAVFLGGVLFGLLLMAVAGWRAGLPKVACVLLAVFQLVDFVAPSHPVPVSHLLLLAALTSISWSLWNGEPVTAKATPGAVPAAA